VEYIEGGALHGASRFCFGCEQLGGVDWGHVEPEEVISAIRLARTRGINFFDTAAVYGLGQSEIRLRTALVPIDNSLTIATKGGLAARHVGEGERANIVRDSSRKALIDGVSESISRLGVSAVSVYFIHWPDPQTPICETMETLMSLKQSGKIGAIGLSNFNDEQIREALRYGDVDVVQLPFSLLSRQAGPIVAMCRENEIPVCAYGVLAQGLLTAKYSSNSQFSDRDRRNRLKHFSPESIKRHLPLVDKLVELADRIQRTPSQIAIRYALQHPGVSAVIVGIKSRLQLRDCIDVFDWTLQQTDIEFLES